MAELASLHRRLLQLPLELQEKILCHLSDDWTTVLNLESQPCITDKDNIHHQQCHQQWSHLLKNSAWRQKKSLTVSLVCCDEWLVPKPTQLFEISKTAQQNGHWCWTLKQTTETPRRVLLLCVEGLWIILTPFDDNIPWYTENLTPNTVDAQNRFLLACELIAHYAKIRALSRSVESLTIAVENRFPLSCGFVLTHLSHLLASFENVRHLRMGLGLWPERVACAPDFPHLWLTILSHCPSLKTLRLCDEQKIYYCKSSVPKSLTDLFTAVKKRQPSRNSELPTDFDKENVRISSRDSPENLTARRDSPENLIRSLNSNLICDKSGLSPEMLTVFVPEGRQIVADVAMTPASGVTMVAERKKQGEGENTFAIFEIECENGRRAKVRLVEGATTDQ